MSGAVDCPLTLGDYIKGVTGFTVPDLTLRAICSKRGVTPYIFVDDMLGSMIRVRDLCIADTYVWAIAQPSGSMRFEEADGNWKSARTTAEIRFGDKVQWRKFADEIYKAYGERVTTSPIKIQSL